MESSSGVSHLLVMDFECTGDVPDSKTWEIIEFPCVILSCTASREIVDIYHHYVRPTKHKALSQQCKDVTKINQETVDKAETLETILDEFYKWIENKALGNFVVVTCGDYDLKTALYSEIKNKNLPTPPKYLHEWINIKIPFSQIFHKSNKNVAGGMADMLKKLKIPLEGQHHSGLDDSKNISKICKLLLEMGWIPQATGKINYETGVVTHAKSKELNDKSSTQPKPNNSGRGRNNQPSGRIQGRGGGRGGGRGRGNRNNESDNKQT